MDIKVKGNKNGHKGERHKKMDIKVKGKKNWNKFTVGYASDTRCCVGSYHQAQYQQ